MPDQKLHSYIQAQVAKGAGRDSISKVLLAAGWSVQDINGAFISLNVPMNSSAGSLVLDAAPAPETQTIPVSNIIPSIENQAASVAPVAVHGMNTKHSLLRKVKKTTTILFIISIALMLLEFFPIPGFSLASGILVIFSPFLFFAALLIRLFLPMESASDTILQTPTTNSFAELKEYKFWRNLLILGTFFLPFGLILDLVCIDNISHCNEGPVRSLIVNIVRIVPAVVMISFLVAFYFRKNLKPKLAIYTLRIPFFFLALVLFLNFLDYISFTFHIPHL